MVRLKEEIKQEILKEMQLTLVADYAYCKSSLRKQIIKEAKSGEGEVKQAIRGFSDNLQNELLRIEREETLPEIKNIVDEIKNNCKDENGNIDEGCVQQILTKLLKANNDIAMEALKKATEEQPDFTLDEWLLKLRRAFNFTWFWSAVGVVGTLVYKITNTSVYKYLLKPIIAIAKKLGDWIWWGVQKIFPTFFAGLKSVGGLAGKGLWGGLKVIFQIMWSISPGYTMLISAAITCFVASLLIKLIRALTTRRQEYTDIVQGLFDWKDILVAIGNVPFNIWKMFKRMYSSIKNRLVGSDKKKDKIVLDKPEKLNEELEYFLITSYQKELLSA